MSYYFPQNICTVLRLNVVLVVPGYDRASNQCVGVLVLTLKPPHEPAVAGDAVEVAMALGHVWAQDHLFLLEID